MDTSEVLSATPDMRWMCLRSLMLERTGQLTTGWKLLGPPYLLLCLMVIAIRSIPVSTSRTYIYHSYGRYPHAAQMIPGLNFFGSFSEWIRNLLSEKNPCPCQDCERTRVVLEPLNLKALQCIAAVEEDPVQRQLAPTSPAIVLYQNGKSHWNMGRKLRFLLKVEFPVNLPFIQFRQKKIICCQQPVTVGH